jgi:hypothetical protein
VDEIGQFIGENTQMMLTLQTIVENLGTTCKGRAWVIVTSQADIDAVIGDNNKARSQDFSKFKAASTLVCPCPVRIPTKSLPNAC